MGYRDGRRIFPPVARAVLASDASPGCQALILAPLLRELVRLGSDMEELSEFVGNPVMVAATRLVEFRFYCGAEHGGEDGPWYWCVGEFGHDGDHEDDNGRVTWPYSV